MAVESEEEDLVIRMINSASALRSETLDLGSKCIYKIPNEILNLKHLESLHLQSNYITELPDEFFLKLTNLKWLDLRNNRLSSLPVSVGKHRTLRSLLLEGNSLTHLPCELGMTRSICGLSLSGNPLEFPPSEIIQKGTKEILKYLREMCDNSAWTKDEVNPLPGAQSDEESDDTDNTSNEEFPGTELPRAGESPPGSDQPCSLDDNPRKISSFKLPPIVRNATTVRRSNSEREIVKGKTVKQFEPARRSTWETIMTSFSDTRIPLPWKRREKRTEEAKEPEEAGSRDERPADCSNKTKTKKSSKKIKKRRMKSEHLPPLSKYEPDNIAGRIDDDERQDENSNTTDTVDASGENALISLVLGDFVAIRVPEEHFIKGQPCVGKVVGEIDERNETLVHYYTGTYDGTFRPMMSRSSPYLRKVSIENILCKFQMQSNGSLSPSTAIRIRQMIERSSS
ncbi:leucine-rich repeat-containing protein 27-like isoform X1 [Dendronephthya gigantea]|uniref:leucine-rich repeat-containing protein 27-like isoform X1 n=1 Tax=Dendronephthya gigantea TaxID=151771 RepID=UPI00106DAB19|nr:leucine-rich repeat-containing protein 27-like isoform X1 [Dendronephthya gigantea]